MCGSNETRVAPRTLAYMLKPRWSAHVFSIELRVLFLESSSLGPANHRSCGSSLPALNVSCCIVWPTHASCTTAGYITKKWTMHRLCSVCDESSATSEFHVEQSLFSRSINARPQSDAVGLERDVRGTQETVVRPLSRRANFFCYALSSWFLNYPPFSCVGQGTHVCVENTDINSPRHRLFTADIPSSTLDMLMILSLS